MKFYQERHFNRRNWLLDNLFKLKITNDEAMLILLIDYYNEYQQPITMELLVEKLNLTAEQVDKAIHTLVNRGYLKITIVDMKPKFQIDEIFEVADHIVINSNIYDLIEAELGKVLSRKDVSTISEWLRIYDYDTIVKALRVALANKKKSIAYIDKILATGEQNDE